MRAILIDAYAKEIREVEHTGHYRHIYDLVSHRLHQVDCFSAVGLGDNRLGQAEAIFIDDEGLFKAENRPDEIRFFKWRGYHQPLAGNGLILAANDEGESVGTALTLDFVRERVTFPDIQLVGWGQPPEDGEVDTPMGKTFVIHGPVPIFGPRAEREAGFDDDIDEDADED